MSNEKIYGQYFFKGTTIKAEQYVPLLRDWLLQNLPRGCVFQQDGAPPHWALVTRDFLNQSLPNKWIGRASDEDAALIHWPPRSPDLTPLDFYLWGFIKTKIYTSPMPKNLTQLRQRIKSVIEEITPATLKRVWGNLERRLVITIKRK